ncbi:hypothetical protein QN416_27155, partial [Glaciimonas sp. Cout2]|uniref:hypothetical protein n=1 Tax=Glaciimonas sp. Cout2 TaxID=3048621 RepID=UPI002B233902
SRPRWLAWVSTFVLALVSVGVADGFAALPASAAVPAVIPRTFDDANADQLTAASILKANGLHGTFYTPSGYINQPGY